MTNTDHNIRIVTNIGKNTKIKIMTNIGIVTNTDPNIRIVTNKERKYKNSD